MKCQQCSTEAPAETDPKSGRLRCSQCKAFQASGTNQSAAVRQARDILQKWSSTDLLDEISSYPSVPPLPDRSYQDEAQRAGPSGKRSQQNTAEETPDLSSDDAPEEQDASAAPRSATTAGHSPNDAAAPSRILSLADAISQQSLLDAATTASVSEPEADTQPPVDKAIDEPQLSLVRDDRAESRHATNVSTDAEISRKATQPRPPSAKTKRRRLTRTPVRRPADSPAATSSRDTQASDSPHQGSNVVKKKLRVDRPGTYTPASAHIPEPTEPTTEDPRAQDASSARRFRVDSAETVNALTDGNGRVRSHGRSRQRYIDEPHESMGLRGPHFEMSPPPRSTLTSLTGQFLAYTGVLGLTVGTAIVIYGHFGGMSEYTPTGWLVTTVAQMLLFLGVINLVSGGIEQNNHDVSHRINVLGEQLMRIEQVTESAMRGPKIPAERYAGTAAAEADSEREHAVVEDRR